ARRRGQGEDRRRVRPSARDDRRGEGASRPYRRLGVARGASGGRRARARRRGGRSARPRRRLRPSRVGRRTGRTGREFGAMARTEAALYGELAVADLELSWSEAELPERERTKHVHRLHPYLGKFIPQLVERLLERYVEPGGHVLDPFAGSGTTLVQALESGYDATGIDVASFNALLMAVKTPPSNPFLLPPHLPALLS